MTSHRRPWPQVPELRTAELALCALGALAVVLLLAGSTGPARAAVAFTARLLVPGWAVVREIRLDDAVVRVALAVALSVSLAGLVSLAMAWRELWHPVPAAVTMLVLSVGAIALRRPRPEETR